MRHGVAFRATPDSSSCVSSFCNKSFNRVVKFDTRLTCKKQTEMYCEENWSMIVFTYLMAILAILYLIEISRDHTCHVYPHGAPEWVYPVPQFKDMCPKCPMCNYEDLVATHPIRRYPEIPRDTAVFQRLVLDWQVKHEIFDHPICRC